MKYIKFPLLFTMLASLEVSPAAASYASTGAVTIARLWNNWSEDTLAVSPLAPVVNPDGCSIAANYSTNPANSGNHLMQALLTSAFMSGRSVTLTLSGCYEGYPEIISVQINPN